MPADVGDLIDGFGSIVLNAPLDGRGVLQGQLPLVGVVAAALGAQDEEPPEPGHVVHGVGVAAKRRRAKGWLQSSAGN